MRSKGWEGSPETDLMPDIIDFVLIADAHVQDGDARALPGIIDRINALDPLPRFVVSLGDNIYGAPHRDGPADMRLYHFHIQRLKCPHYYVLGGHDLEPVEVFHQLTWPELLAIWELPGRWYSFDQGPLHCCVLDSWAHLQPELLAEQLTWFADDLATSTAPLLVFTHEALGFQQSDLPLWVDEDNRNFWPPGNPFETLLEAHSDRLLGVFAGHKHRCLHKCQNLIDYHLVAPAFRHGGQFAQVTLELNGHWAVHAHPPSRPQGPEHDIQQSYRRKPS